MYKTRILIPKPKLNKLICQGVNRATNYYPLACFIMIQNFLFISETSVTRRSDGSIATENISEESSVLSLIR